ncbi:MAG: hypothetical protein AAFN40_27715 [Cyanobacteria bacterium J06560_6]
MTVSNVEIKEDAAVIRSLIDAENRMTNDRINWLITIQGLFFAALSFAWDKADAHGLIVVISFLGIAVSLAAWTSLILANQARAELVKWWTQKYEKCEDYEEVPPVIGIKSFAENQETLFDNIKRALRPWRSLPLLFIAAWISVLIFHSLRS